MEDTPIFTNQEGLWKEPELFSKMKKRYTVLGAIAFFLASAGLPLCGNEWIALGVLVALSAYVIWLVRTPLPAVGLLLTTVLMITLGSSFAAGAVFLSLAVGCMSGAFSDCTKIIIAQRISSVKDADSIIVMNDGCITGIGTHEQLIENNEEYSEIYYSQMDRKEA